MRCQEPAAKQKPVVRVRPHTYQPSKTELDEEVRLDATPEDLVRAVLQPVQIVEDRDA